MSTAGYGNHEPSKPGDASNKPADPQGPGAPGSGGKDGFGTPPADDRRDVATPGDGAGPSGPQGGEVDPGAG